MRRFILAIAIVASASANGFAQTTAPKEEEQVFKMVEQIPEFKGQLRNYLMQNLNYPEAARKGGTQGRVYVQFIVTAEGLVKNVTTIKSSGNIDLDKEAVRVISGMNAPDGTAMWKPGKNNGKAVNSYFTLPIVFTLDNRSAPKK